MSNPNAADITFRDLAALRAMQAYMRERVDVEHHQGRDPVWTDDQIAELSYDLADAMVEERTRRMDTSEEAIEETCGCVHDGPSCYAGPSPGGGYICTRHRGHLGRHVACAVETPPQHLIETWEDDQ